MFRNKTVTILIVAILMTDYKKESMTLRSSKRLYALVSMTVHSTCFARNNVFIFRVLYEE